MTECVMAEALKYTGEVMVLGERGNRGLLEVAVLVFVTDSATKPRESHLFSLCFSFQEHLSIKQWFYF